MRASRILQMRPDRAILALAQLCEERKDETLGPPPPQPRSSFAPPRLTSIPPQAPYTVGSSPMRPGEVLVPAPEDATSRKLSSPVSPVPSSPNDSPGCCFANAKDLPPRLPVDKLDHMAPIRSRWTSPPPPEAPEEDRSAFDDRLDQGLAFATTSSRSHLRDRSYVSSNNSDAHTDDERQSIAESDDLRSVRSFTEEGATHYSREYHERERQLASLHAQQQALQQRLQQQYGIDPSLSSLTSGLPLNSRMEGGVDVKMISRLRGRPAVRVGQQPASPSQAGSGGHATPSDRTEGFTPPCRMDTPRRSMSFPVRNPNRFSLPTIPVVIPNHLAATYQTHLSPTIGHTAPRYILQAAAEARAQAQVNVFYEAVPTQERDPHCGMAGNSPQMPFGSPQMLYGHVNFYVGEPSGSRSQSQSRSRSGSRTRLNLQQDSPVMVRRETSTHGEEPVAGPSRLPGDVPAPGSPQIGHTQSERIYSHHHTHSNATVTAPTPPANVRNFAPAASVAVPISLPMPMGTTLGPRHSRSRSRSPPYLPTQRNPPYAYQTTYPSPRMGATNLPPRLRADRDRNLALSGQVSHPGLTALPSQSPLLDTYTLPTSVDVEHLRTDSQVHVPVMMRSTSPFASHSSGSGSPPMSCTSSQYAPSSSPLSTSPPSPAQGDLKGRREGEDVGVVSPLRSPIPLLDEPASMAMAIPSPEDHAVDVFGKEKEPATPIPISLASSPVPAPAPTPTIPIAVLGLPVEEAKLVDAVVSAEKKREVESPKAALPEAGSLPQGVTGGAKESSHVSPPEVLITESSPTTKHTPEASTDGHAAIPAVVEQAQGPSAGS